jgi:hypothetical protein
MTTSYTGRVLTGDKRESTSQQVDLDGHSRPLSFLIADIDPSSVNITAITGGQAVGQYAADGTNYKSGYIYPTTYEDVQFIGVAQKSVSLRGSSTTLLGYEVSVITHGFVGNCKADGVILIGQQVTSSGKAVLLGSNDTVNGSFKVVPPVVIESRTITAPEAAANAIVLKFKPAGILAVREVSATAAAKTIVPNAKTLAANECKIGADGVTLNFYAAELAGSDVYAIDYFPDPKIIAGKAMSYAADNGLFDLLVKEV